MKFRILALAASLAAKSLCGAEAPVLFNFEDGTTQGWTMVGALGSGLAPSKQNAVDGKASLEVKLDSKAASSQTMLKVDQHLEGLGPGSTIRFKVWVPAGAAFTGFEPYEIDGAGGWDGVWTGGFEAGQWNTFVYRVPCSAVAPIKEIGFYIFAGAPLQGSVFLDSISGTLGSNSGRPQRSNPKKRILSPLAAALSRGSHGPLLVRLLALANTADALDGHERPQMGQGAKAEDSLLAPPPGTKTAGVKLAEPTSEDLRSLDEIDEGPLGVQGTGNILVPTSQLLTPAGRSLTFSGRPVDLALSPDGATLAVLNMKDLVFIDVAGEKIREILPLVSAEADCQNEAREGSFTGILYGPDGTLYYSTVQGLGMYRRGKRLLIPMELPCGLALSPDGRRLYVALNKANQLGIVDLQKQELTEVMDVGMAPYGVVAGPEGKVYVGNWGGHVPTDGQVTGLTISDRHTDPKLAQKVLIDPKTGSASDGTVSVVDLEHDTLKTISVGKLPTGLTLSADGKRLYVSNANSDTVSVIDTISDTVVASLDVRPDNSLPFGSAPNGMAVYGDTLYVANAGNNALAVLDLEKGGVSVKGMGFIPTAWYPSSVVLARGGKLLCVANTKGYGSLDGPVGKRDIHEHLGSVSLIPVPAATELPAHTRRVQENNRMAKALAGLKPPRPGQKPVVLPERHGEPSLIKHVLYIIKENKTYDGVLGDAPGGDGDPSLCMFCDVTPNAHKLAAEFVLLDHFYCSGVLSADGHQWTDEAYVTSYLEKSFAAFPRSYPSEGQDALALSPAGFLWSNALAHGLTFRDYGESVEATLIPEKATWKQYYDDYVHNTHKVSFTVAPNIGPLGPYLCPDFPGWPMTIPDVAKARVFINELKGFERSGKLPNLMMMCLPNDHTGGTGPGSPTPRAQVADNDLALGQIVEAVTRSKFWKDTAIFVVEDDPQGMPDHVDGHRTVAQVISPYTRRRTVDHKNYNQCGMVKTMELMLGLPPMNQFDLAATPMDGCFTNKANLGIYKAVPAKVPLDQINAALDKLGPKERYWAEQSMKIPMHEPGKKSEEQDAMLSRILWHATRGVDTPYPHSAADKLEEEEARGGERE